MQYQEPEFEFVEYEESVKTLIYKSTGTGDDDSVDYGELFG